MLAKPKRIDAPKHITLCLDVEEVAELLRHIRKRKSDVMQSILKDIDEELTPEYIYDVKCTDCPRVFEVKSKEEIEQKRIDKGGICANCSDDYK